VDVYESFVPRLIGRYLAAHNRGVTFVHALIADSVRTTIAMPFPYRRRIIDALHRLDDRVQERTALLAAQYAACGEQDMAFACLAERAASADDPRLIVAASEGALRYGKPPKDEQLTFYRRYTGALFALDESLQASTVFQQALQDAQRAGIDVPPSAAAHLITLYTDCGLLRMAQAVYERFQGDGSQDAGELHAAALAITVPRNDRDAFERISERCAPADERTGLSIRFRTAYYRALMLMLSGDYARATAQLDEAAAAAQREVPESPVPLSVQLAYARALIALWQYGTVHDVLDSAHPYAAYFRAQSRFLDGRWNEAELIATSALDSWERGIDRRRLLIVATAISALRGQPSGYEALVDHDVALFVAGNREPSTLALCAWWCAAGGTTHGNERVASIVRSLADACDATILFHYLPVRFPLVVAAHRIGDRDLLNRLSVVRSPDPDTPWHRAHARAAAALAAALLGASKTREHESAARACRDLGMELYADLILAAFAPADAAALSRLAASGVTPLSVHGLAGAPRRSAVRPSARELQVASEIAAGRSNTEIATALSLSQRTVEAHIAHLFNKLGLTSRTQVAAWYMREFPVGA
jgi:DNA-binding CsgD family transcriptional regulator